MARKIEKFEEFLSDKFDNEKFVEFIREFLNDVEIVNPYRINAEYNSAFSFYVAGYNHIANYTDSKRNKIAIISVALKSGETVERARSMQRNYVRKLMDAGNYQGAIVAFYVPENCDVWRLSLVRLWSLSQPVHWHGAVCVRPPVHSRPPGQVLQSPEPAHRTAERCRRSPSWIHHP